MHYVCAKLEEKVNLLKLRIVVLEQTNEKLHQALVSTNTPALEKEEQRYQQLEGISNLVA